MVKDKTLPTPIRIGDASVRLLPIEGIEGDDTMRPLHDALLKFFRCARLPGSDAPEVVPGNLELVGSVYQLDIGEF